MVRISLAAVFAASILSVSAKCDKLKLKFQPNDGPNCIDATLRDTKKIKLNHCRDFDDFQSYTAYPYHEDKSPLKGRDCHVIVYDQPKCRGEGMRGEDLRKGAATCGKAIFTNPTSKKQTQGKSAKFVCVPDPKPSSTRPVPPPASTVTMTVEPVVKSTLTLSSTITVSASSTPVTTIVRIVKTVTMSPSTSPTSSIPKGTATVTSMLTIMGTPVATVSGTVTRYTPKSSRASVRIFTITYDKANKDRQAQPKATGAERRAIDDVDVKRDVEEDEEAAC